MCVRSCSSIGLLFPVTQTYGPFTRSYTQPAWSSLPLEQRAKLMARQGHSFATADEARVVTKSRGGGSVDVPQDGNTLGEIAVRGNIVMKEVSVRILF